MGVTVFFRVRGRLWFSDELTLALIDAALEGKVALRPEWMRAL